MKQETVKAMFTLAGIEILAMKALIDGYGYGPDDPRFTETLPRCVWWFVKTPFGWVEFGERKRVIAINWDHTPIRQIITEDDTTKDETGVHAWTDLKAVEYLKELNRVACLQPA